MDEKSYLNKIKHAIYDDINSNRIRKYEKDLLLKVQFEADNKNNVSLLLGRLYFEQDDYKNSLKYFSLARYKNPLVKYSYLGLYKCYVMMDDYISALEAINTYIGNNSKINCDIILSMLDKLTFNKGNITINKERYMREQFSGELKLKYSEFIDSYETRNYSKALCLLKECSSLVKEKNICLEFKTLSHLLEKIKEKDDVLAKSNLSNLYHSLELAINHKDYDVALNYLTTILKYNIKNYNLIYYSLYTLIKNGYCNECTSLIEKINFNKRDSDIEKFFRNTINNEKKLNDLNNDSMEVYNKAIYIGHNYYVSGYLFDAYDVYMWGYYLTKMPVFIYYMAKMLYKNRNYEEAKEYFMEYILVGSEKLSKAYLYLTCLNSKNKNGIKYASLMNKLSFVCHNDFTIDYIYDRKESGIDIHKMKVQKRLRNSFKEDDFK